MSLVITRSAGTSIYLGTRLNPDDLEGSFCARVEVTHLSSPPRATLAISHQQVCPRACRPSRAVSTESRELCERAPVLKIEIGDLFGGHEVWIRLLGVEQETRSPARRLEARLAIVAPPEVAILRDNARCRTPQEQTA